MQRTLNVVRYRTPNGEKKLAVDGDGHLLKELGPRGVVISHIAFRSSDFHQPQERALFNELAASIEITQELCTGLNFTHPLQTILSGVVEQLRICEEQLPSELPTA